MTEINTNGSDPEVDAMLTDLGDRTRFSGYAWALNDVLDLAEKRAANRISKTISLREMVDITEALIAAAIAHKDDVGHRLPAR